MEDNLILEGLLSMVTELKERQEKQVMPASREETINRLDVIEQRISEMQSKSGITENMVRGHDKPLYIFKVLFLILGLPFSDTADLV